VDISKIKSAIETVETLRQKLAEAEQSLADACIADDKPIDLVQTTKAERVGNRKPRAPKPERTTPSRPARVAPESIERVANNLTSELRDSDAIGDGTELRKPTILAALAILVEQGRAVKVGQARGARWKSSAVHAEAAQ
jgi:biotin carboxyl carrier protein